MPRNMDLWTTAAGVIFDGLETPARPRLAAPARPGPPARARLGSFALRYLLELELHPVNGVSLQLPRAT